jgi:hypothetical protein
MIDWIITIAMVNKILTVLTLIAMVFLAKTIKDTYSDVKKCNKRKMEKALKKLTEGGG